MTEFAARPWVELRRHIDQEPICVDLHGSDGVEYQIETNLFWDDDKKTRIRITGSIDDGGIRSYFPLTQDIIKEQETSEISP